MKIETIEEDPVERLDEVAPGSRMFIVSVFDPDRQEAVFGATIIEVERLEGIDEICRQRNTPFSRGIMFAAAEQVIGRMYSGSPPDGIEVENVTEVSRRELKEIVTLSRAGREKTFGEGGTAS